MLDIIVILVVPLLLISAISTIAGRIMVKRIQGCQYQSDRIKLREQYTKWFKIIVWTVFGIVLFLLFIACFSLLLLMIANGFNYSVTVDDKIIAFIPLFLALLLESGIVIFYARETIRKQTQKISTVSVKQYLEKHSDFILFLRRFLNDDYSSENKLSKMNKSDSFSEYLFVNVLKSKTEVCAVGMPEELTTPVGATRVYAYEDRWQEDVYLLMERATSIYILVDSRPSCVWEINKTAVFLFKTHFLVDDREQYEQVRESNGFLPKIPESFNGIQHMMLSFENGEPVFRPYENTELSYCDLLGFDRKQLSPRGSIFSFFSLEGCLPAIIIIAVIIMLAIIIGTIAK